MSKLNYFGLIIVCIFVFSICFSVSAYAGGGTFLEDLLDWLGVKPTGMPLISPLTQTYGCPPLCTNTGVTDLLEKMECTEDRNCLLYGNNYICKDSKCVPDPTAISSIITKDPSDITQVIDTGLFCKNHIDCKSGFCVRGICHDDAYVCGDGFCDSHLGESFLCQNGPNPDCTKDELFGLDCLSNAQCPLGMKCNIKTRICIKSMIIPPCVTYEDCAIGEDCIAGVCAIVKCISDADCAQDYICQNNICVLSELPDDQECQTNDDCSAPLSLCIGGNCVECGSDENCLANYQCIDNFCKQRTIIPIQECNPGSKKCVNYAQAIGGVVKICDNNGLWQYDALCPNGCNIDTFECRIQREICGNNITEGSEQCDRTNLDGKTCASLGYKSGTLSCVNYLCIFDKSKCEVQECSINMDCPGDLICTTEGKCAEPVYEDDAKQLINNALLLSGSIDLPLEIKNKVSVAEAYLKNGDYILAKRSADDVINYANADSNMNNIKGTLTIMEANIETEKNLLKKTRMEATIRRAKEMITEIEDMIEVGNYEIAAKLSANLIKFYEAKPILDISITKIDSLKLRGDFNLTSLEDKITEAEQALEDGEYEKAKILANQVRTAAEYIDQATGGLEAKQQPTGIELDFENINIYLIAGVILIIIIVIAFKKKLLARKRNMKSSL